MNLLSYLKSFIHFEFGMYLVKPAYRFYRQVQFAHYGLFTGQLPDNYAYLVLLYSTDQAKP